MNVYIIVVGVNFFRCVKNGIDVIRNVFHH